MTTAEATDAPRPPLTRSQWARCAFFALGGAIGVWGLVEADPEAWSLWPLVGALVVAAVFFKLQLDDRGVLFLVAAGVAVASLYVDWLPDFVWIGAVFHLVVLGLCSLLLPVLVFLVRRMERADAADQPPARRVIALTGYAGAGKDAVARGLTWSGWTRVSFADKLREFLYALNPTVVVPPLSSEVFGKHHIMPLADLVDARGWDAAKRVPQVRELLQRVGTDAGRELLGENVWVDAVLGDLPDGDIVITDCRFLNEAEAVKAIGGKVVRVRRPGVTQVNGHVSETALDDYPVDAVLDNDDTAHAGAVALRKLVQNQLYG